MTTLLQNFHNCNIWMAVKSLVRCKLKLVSSSHNWRYIVQLFPTPGLVHPLHAALSQLQVELRHLAEQARRKKAEKAAKAKKSSTTVNRTVAASGAVVEDVDEDEDVREGRVDDEDDANRMTENTPEERVKIYQELAQQKREKEERERTNAPKERDYEAEHAESVTSVRQKESELPDM